MEIVGGGSVHVYEAVDEGPHAPGPQELWQESVFLLWWDLVQGIGGFYRIGHEINHATGPMIALWSTTFSPHGHYKKTTYLPLRPEDRLPDGFGSGEGTVRYTFDGQCVWTMKTSRRRCASTTSIPASIAIRRRASSRSSPPTTWR